MAEAASAVAPLAPVATAGPEASDAAALLPAPAAAIPPPAVEGATIREAAVAAPANVRARHAAALVPKARPERPPAAEQEPAKPRETSPDVEREPPVRVSDAGDAASNSRPSAGQPAATPSVPGGPGSSASSNVDGAAGSANVPPGYLARLRTWLEQHKRYPRRARLARQEGTVTLVFVMDRDGSVQEARIARSSGSATLDDEARAMLRRAVPLPPLPAEVAGSSLIVNVPVEFEIP